MHPDLTALKAIDELDRLIGESRTRPLLLFKHSYTCGTSMEALDEIVAHLNEPGLGIRDSGLEAQPRYAMVTVQTHRDVSNAISARLGVRHQTPQALLVRNGLVVWSASHFRVTANAVQDAINQS